MKQLLTLLIAAVFATTAIAADKKEPSKKATAEKKEPAKKEVKKHKKFEGEKVPEKAPAKKK